MSDRANGAMLGAPSGAKPGRKRRTDPTADARRMLERYASVRAQIRMLTKALEEGRADAEDLRGKARKRFELHAAVIPKRDPVRESVVRVIERIDKRVRGIARRIEMLQCEQAMVDRMLEALPTEMQNIARLRYIDRRSWPVVSAELHISQRQLLRYDAILLRALAAAYEDMRARNARLARCKRPPRDGAK